MMHKIIRCFIGILFLGCFLIGYKDAFAAVESIRYISNRIKIQRPQTMATEQQAAAKAAGEKGKTAQEQASSEETTEKMAALSIEEQNELFMGTQGRFYTRQGKVDPFEPFLRIPEAQVSEAEQEKLQIRPPQTPLERFDLSQLKLTGILLAPGKIRALIQESSGKGFIISEGTYIGNKGGQVTKILNDRIVVEEKYIDVLGKVAVREIELKLRKGQD